MKILAIDTCLGGLTIALDIDGMIYNSNSKEFNQQSKLLPHELSNLLKKAKIEVRDLNKILITKGPGSFTGIRVGIAFVKGLGASLDIEILACSTLSCLDINYTDNFLNTLSAGNENYYTQQFNKGLPQGEIKILSSDELKMQENEITILGHFLEPTIVTSAVKMLKHYKDDALKNVIFDSNLTPLYIKESYF